MEIDTSVLKNDEIAIFKLRSLYKKYGYTQYKMNKFEEYDLYVKNKDFLVSDNIITFTDTDGKLMALKPDVTLSIIKNSEDIPGNIQKLYYNENVYRISKGSRTFKEIMQTGLECIGDIDLCCICEVLFLAAKSLKSISNDFVLDISHMGIVSELINSLGIESSREILKCIGEKNSHELEKICTQSGAQKESLKKLLSLVSLYGAPDKVLPELEKIIPNSPSLFELKKIISGLSALGLSKKINIDFSVVNDMNYYNAIVFKGFIKGIPTGILSGGQYDRLMRKMGRKSGAVGFAVYLDMLELLPEAENEFDVDTVILYNDSCDISNLFAAVSMLTGAGKSVLAQKQIPEKLKFKQLLTLNEKGVEILENNA